uniref:GP n=1 Tax=Tiliqua thogotovirus TaxID=2992311 RepID=A0A9E7V604_9ORTO|nr:GP [Tiliqua thogotovirus]
MYTKFLILLCCKLAQSQCDYSRASGPYHLSAYNPPVIDTDYEEVNATKFSFLEENEDLYIGHRSYWKAYCYNGGPLDANTGCVGDIINVPPTKEELKAWAKTGKCCTGQDYYDRWGSDAAICLSTLPNNSSCHTRKELIRVERNYKFAYHMCHISWRCGISKSSAYFGLEINGSSISKKSYFPNGTSKVHTEPIYLTEDDTAFYFGGNGSVHKEQVKLKCFYENSKSKKIFDTMSSSNMRAALIALLTISETGDVYCQEGHEFFKASTETSYCGRHSCYTWTKPIVTHRINQSIQTINSSDTSGASIEDVKNVLHMLNWELEALRMSFKELDARHRKTSEVLDLMVESISKIDDRLIGNILGTDQSSRFIDKRHFFLHQCSGTGKTTNITYRDGRETPVSLDISHITQNFTHVNSTPIVILEAGKLWYPKAHTVELRGTVKEEPGWTFYANAKEALSQSLIISHHGGAGTSLEDILSLPAGAIASMMHWSWWTGWFHYALYGVVGFLVFKLIRGTGLFSTAGHTTT